MAAFCLLVTMTMCFVFGGAVWQKQLVPVEVPLGLIALVAIYILSERYDIHVVEKRPLRN